MTSERLPRRDLILIPLISFVTCLLMVGAAELASRFYFDEYGKESCSRPDPLHGYRLSGNCTSHRKSAEGPLVENAYNGCGYRTRESCGTPPVGTIRISLMGASTAQGFKALYDEAFAPRAAASLGKACARPVEFQNMGVAGYKLIDQYLRVDEALALKPAAAVLVLSAYELVDITDPLWLQARSDKAALVRLRQQRPASQARPSLIARVDALVQESRALVAAQHFLYSDRAKYVEMFLLHGDKADYLRSPLSANWEKRLADLDLLVAEMAAAMRAQGVPLVLVLAPQRIQAALLDAKLKPAGIDPDMIGRSIATIAKRHGIVFIDTLSAFANVPHPERLFYPVDGHMTGEGHGLFADALQQGLLASGMSAFNACTAAPVAASPQAKS